MDLAESLRVDHDADIHREAAFLGVEIQVDGNHLAKLDAQELHRGTDLEAA